MRSSADYTRPLLIGIVGTGFNAKFHIRSLVHVRNCVVTGIVGSKWNEETNQPTDSAKECVDLARSMKVGDPVIYKDIESMVHSPSVEAIW
jgi:predicted dehydrogenase